MPEFTIADLRARVDALTDRTYLPKTHPLWRLLDNLEAVVAEHEIPGPSLNGPVSPDNAPLIWWLLDDLVSASESSAKAHLKIMAQEVEMAAWTNAALALSQMLATMVRSGKVSMSGRTGEARRKAVEWVAKHGGRTDVLGTRPASEAYLRPRSERRGTRAGMSDGWHHTEDTPSL